MLDPLLAMVPKLAEPTAVNTPMSQKEKTSFGGNEVLGGRSRRLWGKDLLAASDFIVMQWSHHIAAFKTLTITNKTKMPIE